MNYTVQTKIATIPATRLDEFRDPERFLGYCRQCPSYNTKYSCPPHEDINDEEYLGRFAYAHMILTQIIYDEETITSTRDDKQKQNEVLYLSRAEVAGKIEEMKLKKEETGGVSVSNSVCSVCKDCTRTSGLPCRHPEKMRYAIDSFGFDITKILSELFGAELSWPKDTIPVYQCLVGMFLSDDECFSLDEE